MLSFVLQRKKGVLETRITSSLTLHARPILSTLLRHYWLWPTCTKTTDIHLILTPPADLFFLQPGFYVAINPATTLSLSNPALQPCFHWSEDSVLWISYTPAVILLVYCMVSVKSCSPNARKQSTVNKFSCVSGLQVSSTSSFCAWEALHALLCCYRNLFSFIWICYLISCIWKQQNPYRSPGFIPQSAQNSALPQANVVLIRQQEQTRFHDQSRLKRATGPHIQRSLIIFAIKNPLLAFKCIVQISLFLCSHLPGRVGNVSGVTQVSLLLEQWELSK